MRLHEQVDKYRLSFKFCDFTSRPTNTVGTFILASSLEDFLTSNRQSTSSSVGKLTRLRAAAPRHSGNRDAIVCSHIHRWSSQAHRAGRSSVSLTCLRRFTSLASMVTFASLSTSSNTLTSLLYKQLLITVRSATTACTNER